MHWRYQNDKAFIVNGELVSWFAPSSLIKYSDNIPITQLQCTSLHRNHPSPLPMCSCCVSFTVLTMVHDWFMLTEPRALTPNTCHAADCSCFRWLKWKCVIAVLFLSGSSVWATELCCCVYCHDWSVQTFYTNSIASVVGWCYKLTIWFGRNFCIIVVSVLFMLGA